MKHALVRFISSVLILVLLTPAALAYEKLQQGAYGNSVLKMQQALRSLGYELTTDGKYGKDTAAVVRQFQRDNKLSVDGVAGTSTLSLLYTLAPAYAQASNASYASNAASSASAGNTAWVNGGSLNLRGGPAENAPLITEIPNNAQVTVVQRGALWTSVLYNGLAGYVMTAYLSFGTAPVQTQPTAAPALIQTGGNVQAMVVTTGGSLNLRQNPSSTAKVLTTIPNGAWLTVSARGSEWCQVVFNGLSGYVMSKFLSIGTSPVITPTSASSPSPTPFVIPTQVPYNQTGVTAYVHTSGGSLNLREAAQSSARILARIPNGTPLTVTQRGAVWCTVLYQNLAGYVMTSFLSFTSSASNPVTLSPSSTPAPSPTPSPTPAAQSGASIGTALITTSGGTLNLRAEASYSARVLCAMPNASSVTVYSRGAVWSQISYQGTNGYCLTQYLTFLNGIPTQNADTEEDDPSKYTRTLKKGMTGSDVTWVQNRLIELGYSLSLTNLYDDATFAAVKAFQTQNGLNADGLAGSQTFSILKSASARKAGDAKLSYSTLRIDDTGDGVKQLQTDLKALGYPVTVSGTYDVTTHDAVVAFQQRNSLVISGVADSLTRQTLHSGAGKPYSTPVDVLPANEGKIQGPSVSELKLLHWQNEIKPTVKTGQTFTVFDPNTNLSWKLVFYSLGRHADSQPASWRDTQIMNRAFGTGSWTIHPVYVQLPNGQWTVATMHNRPHLYGSITDNGFGGHLCVHFLRDMAEAQKNDPNYGVNNQVTLRNTWKALTGETVN